jgi:hypothetical protein
MKKLFLLLAFLLVIGCTSQNTQKQEQANPEPATEAEDPAKTGEPPALDFDDLPADGVGVIIGTPKVLRADKVPTDQSPFRTGMVVQILAKSTARFSKNGSKDDCDKFPFIKVKADSSVQWILGGDLFAFYEPDQGPVFSVGNDHYRVIKAKNFGLGAVDEDGLLTNCNEFYPLLFKNRDSQNYKLISLSKSDKPKYNNFAFANLNRDGHKLLDIQTDSLAVVLKFDAEYMEDAESYEIRINDLGSSIVTGLMQNRKERAFTN